MMNINVLIATIILGIYLIIFVTVIYPKKDQSKKDKFMPFAVEMLVMGIFYGLFIYYEYIRSRPNTLFEADFSPVSTFMFIWLLIGVLVLHYAGDFGGFFSALGFLGSGLAFYIFLCIIIAFSLTEPTNYVSQNIENLYLGLLCIPLTIIGLLASRTYVEQGDFFEEGDFPKLVYSVFLAYSIGPTLLGMHCVVHLDITLGVLLAIGGILGLCITVYKLVQLVYEKGTYK